MTRAGLVVALLACAARAGEAEDALRDLRKDWGALDASARAGRLRHLANFPGPDVLAEASKRLSEDDLGVRAAAASVVAACAADSKLRAKAEPALAACLRKQLDERARREDAEFRAVVKEHGRKLPPEDFMAADDWKDPWDEKRRALPPDVRAERAFMLAFLDSVEAVRAVSLRPLLLRVFEEHHDPEVLVRVVRLFQAWREWGALVPMADLARIQQYGREIGGSLVIGDEAWETLRLKWDVHKDRLWWSRPEYVPRVVRPIFAAASATTGAEIGSARDLDSWLLAHEAELRGKGVVLDAGFRKRAEVTRR